jgi:hypothetical protein
MAMLTLNGTLQNVFTKPESKDPKTGEIRPASLNAQILAENITPTGEKRLEMVTLKVHTDAFLKLVGQKIRVPVGAFSADGTIKFYALKNEVQPTAA